MRFIDLFAGLGGFHKALSDLGHNCVFASESNPELRELYRRNWGILPEGDIRPIVDANPEAVPQHDVLCAGFPCQPFSKAGKQLGRLDENHGGLFDYILKILEAKEPEYFILENVPLIASHDNEATWSRMQAELELLGYEVDYAMLSPHKFGVPQHRWRMFIVGARSGLRGFNFSTVCSEKQELVEVRDFVDVLPVESRKLSAKNIHQLALWQEFLNSVPDDIDLPAVPIWSMEFGATYPFEDEPAELHNSRSLGQYRGSFGQPLAGLRKSDQLAHIPRYAHGKRKFPEWKKHFIRSNRAFYLAHKKALRETVRKIARSEHFSWQKLEWNVDKRARNIYDYLIQFRASGIRVKSANYFPSLVCTNTQVPIIGWEKRYITRSEALRLQSLGNIQLPESDNAAFRALGNAVNAKVVRIVAEHLITSTDKPLLGKAAARAIEVVQLRPFFSTRSGTA